MYLKHACLPISPPRLRDVALLLGIDRHYEVWANGSQLPKPIFQQIPGNFAEGHPCSVLLSNVAER